MGCLRIASLGNSGVFPLFVYGEAVVSWQWRDFAGGFCGEMGGSGVARLM